jgi:hypothetical protein
MAKMVTPEIVRPKRFTCVCRDIAPRVCQGDVFGGIEYIESFKAGTDKVSASVIVFPFIIVLTQDCDLEQDHTLRSGAKNANQDKHLLSLLVAPMYNFEHVRAGNHLIGLDMTMERINSNKASFVKNNEIARYHYLEFDPNEVPIPPSVIDFKHYFSVNVEYLRSMIATNWVCKIAELHRENVCQRFASFLARIGLPDAPKAMD